MTINDRLIRILARKFATPSSPEDDLFQEGTLAYMRALQTFDPTRDTKLETYASRVITNRFIDISRRQADSVVELVEDEMSGASYPANSLDDEMNLQEIKKILATHVADLDRAIFNSYIEGFSYEEMGKIFDLPRKKIDNTVQKVKKIIKQFI